MKWDKIAGVRRELKKMAREAMGREYIFSVTFACMMNLIPWVIHKSLGSHWAVGIISSTIRRCGFAGLSIPLLCFSLRIILRNMLIVLPISIFVQQNMRVGAQDSLYQIFYKPQGQRWINLWHGCGYKAAKGQSEHIRFDYCLVPGKLFIESKAAFFACEKEKLLTLGYPRYDLLLSPCDRVRHFLTKKKVQTSTDKVIIWMPTYRKTEDSRFAEHIELGRYGLPFIHDRKQMKQLDHWCRQRRILLLVKHHMMETEVVEEQLTCVQFIQESDLEMAGIQLYELLGQTDALMTDYSSVAVDYMLCDKPIAFLLEDYEAYRKNRGFVFEDPLQYMPGYHVRKAEEFLAFLDDIAQESDSYRDKRQSLMDLMHNRTNDYCGRLLAYLNL